MNHDLQWLMFPDVCWAVAVSFAWLLILEQIEHNKWRKRGKSIRDFVRRNTLP